MDATTPRAALAAEAKRQPAPETRHVLERCRSVAPILARVGDKWSMLIIIVLIDGPCRFNALKRRIDGISQQMLTRVLKALERDGLISRTTYPTSPPQVEYALTELGLSLSEPVLRLGDWVRDNLGGIEEAREAYDGK
ncbi:winged helix-turn-helix transcriptional regulator [Martelella soudanensis]|uniref:winged helix-turn-helix transcriptional regulator n=1 Tax=unclassified Martelella TaxID=2629616 RepID=UPI0015DDDF70|nr:MULTISPECIES: helix-turn-helix domain-containing protein [unclassified Martelella]